jgi:hypothetical protein
LIFTIISRFANQTIPIHRLVSEDSYGGNVYDPPLNQNPEEIPGRYDPRYGTTRGFGGEERNDSGVILTEEQLSVGDIAANSEIRGVEPIINKKGITLGYRVFL